MVQILRICVQVATRSSHGLEVDVWGLGCLLYTWLVGRPPFDTQGVRSTLTKVGRIESIIDICRTIWLNLN